MVYHLLDLPGPARVNGKQHLLTMDEFASSLERTDRRKKATRVSRLIQDMGQEALKGAALSMPRVVCVGTKAGEEVKRE